MFVFYDTETTGLDHDFSQILQIGLIFTDDDLNTLSSKKVECRSSPWVVPAPGALLTTGFSPDDLKFNKLSNYEMMHAVNDWLRGQHWPVTFVGYNSIGYDEPVLAQNFFQNLLDPGLTTSKNKANNQSNGVADVMVLVKAVAAYMPGVLKLDVMNDFGTPSLTLINVARQNGVILSDDDAHDAMNDIKATVGVAKFLRKAAPAVWEQMMTLSTAEGVDTFLNSNKVFTYTNGSRKSSVMTSLDGKASGAAVQAPLYDLSIDPTPYLKMTPEQLKNVLQSKGTKPFVLVRKGSQPILMPLELSEPVLPAAYDEKLYAARARTLRSHKVFLDNVAKAVALVKQEQAALTPTSYPEKLIGKEVPAPVQKNIDIWIRAFHDADSWHDAAALVSNFPVRFKDELAADPSLIRFARFAERIVYEHAPQELSKEKQDSLKTHIAERLLNPDLKAPYMTIAKARKELQQIELERSWGKNKKWDHVTDTQIRALKLYYTSIEKEYAPFLPTPPVNDNAPVVPEVKKPPNNGPKI